MARRGKKTMEQALAEGAAQIRNGGYAEELAAAGVAPVHALVVAFDGKRVKVRGAGEKKRGASRKAAASGGAKGAKTRAAKGC